MNPVTFTLSELHPYPNLIESQIAVEELDRGQASFRFEHSSTQDVDRHHEKGLQFPPFYK